MAASMDEWICRENLTRLRRQLQDTPNPHERDVLNELIAHERAKLDQLLRTNKLR